VFPRMRAWALAAFRSRGPHFLDSSVCFAITHMSGRVPALGAGVACYIADLMCPTFSANGTPYIVFVQLGTNKRAKAKREELKNVYAAQRSAAAKASSA